MSDDDAIDPRLRAALRHAPDGDLAPPTALDRSIMAAAQLSVARSSPAGSAGAIPKGAPPWPSWRRWFEHLLQAPAAAALATVALGTLIGVLWHGGVPPLAQPDAVAAAPVALPAERVRPAAPVTSLADAKLALQPSPPTEAARQIGKAPSPENESPGVKPTAPPAPALGKEFAQRGAARNSPVSQAQADSSTAEAPVESSATPPMAPAVVAAASPAAAESASSPSTALHEKSVPAQPDAAGASGTSARLPLAAKTNTARTEIELPPILELLQAASSPWVRVPADRMPEGGTLMHDATGQTVTGRVIIERDTLWWQPWANGQAAQYALRAATSTHDARALQQRWPLRMGLSPGKQ